MMRAVLFSIVALLPCAMNASPDASSPSLGNVTWDTPSATSAGSLPLGNGDLAANVWVEPSGDIVFYLSKSDAWDHLSRLIKLGRLRMRFSPALETSAAAQFKTELDLATASVHVTAATATRHASVRLWADANHPRFAIDVESSAPVSVEAQLDPWRAAPRELTGLEKRGAYGVTESPAPLVAMPDTVVDSSGAEVVWYHRNETSIWASTLDHQSLGEFKARSVDPLLHRTFGGLLSGAGFVRADSRTLRTTKPVTAATLMVTALTAQTSSPGEWVTAIRQQAAELAQLPPADAWHAHIDYWRAFWARSYIAVETRTPDWDGARNLTAAYLRQRYLIACSGRGAFPIKFNGSLFTADWNLPDEPFDADYRRWGGAYWFQNTRLPYWTLAAAGDTEFLRPLARMYLAALPLAEFRTYHWYGHGGAFFPETFYFWGTHLNDNYGWKRDGLAAGEVVNRYIGRHFNGGLELLALLLDAYVHEPDSTLLDDTLLPLARPVLQFFAEHYPRDAHGRLHLAPAQALETWWECENPAPDVAGLHDVLAQLLALPASVLPTADRHAWESLQAILPPIPLVTTDGPTHLAPAAVHELAPRNLENAELYPVFPFKLYGVGRPDLAIGRETFLRRTFQDTGGWRQDALHAALLGLTEPATYYVLKNATSFSSARFPGFFGPNYDWLPDMDHASVTNLTLQAMLLQCVGEKIYLFPAWPGDRWNVRFRLHANAHTLVEGELRDGQLVHLDVTPAARRKDVVVLLGTNKAKLLP